MNSFCWLNFGLETGRGLLLLLISKVVLEEVGVTVRLLLGLLAFLDLLNLSRLLLGWGTEFVILCRRLLLQKIQIV